MTSTTTRTTATGTLTQTDWDDMYLAHQYRLSLSSSPPQSSFRVVALLFYKLLQQQEPAGNNSDEDIIITAPKSKMAMMIPPFFLVGSRTASDGRTYVVGTNDEPGYMGGSVCAERAAMVQFRFAPPHVITKIVIATDSNAPIAPGMLCREFLAGKLQVSWNIPILSSGNCCATCQLQDFDLFNTTTTTKSSLSTCSSRVNKDATQQKENYLRHHDIAVLYSNLIELYPYPSPCTRLRTADSIILGEAYLANINNSGKDDNTLNANSPPSILSSLDMEAKSLLDMAIEQARGKTARNTNSEDNKNNHNDNDGPYPIHFGAAVKFQDGSTVSCRQQSALEYGCSLDAVSQLASHIVSKSENENDNYPILIVQADQYGIVHAPFAPARAFLTEQGYGSCDVLVHDLESINHDTIMNDYQFDKWKLIRVKAADLAPTPPAWK